MAKETQRQDDRYEEEPVVGTGFEGDHYEIYDQDPIKGTRLSTINPETGELIQERRDTFITEFPEYSKYQPKGKGFPIRIVKMGNLYKGDIEMQGSNIKKTGKTPAEVCNNMERAIEAKLDLWTAIGGAKGEEKVTETNFMKYLERKRA